MTLIANERIFISLVICMKACEMTGWRVLILHL